MAFYYNFIFNSVATYRPTLENLVQPTPDSETSLHKSGQGCQ
jgi:hypothetical protein